MESDTYTYDCVYCSKPTGSSCCDVSLQGFDDQSDVFNLCCMFLQRGSGSKAASSPAENYQLARRRTLQVVVSALLTESGFESAEKAAVETLTEMMQSCTYQP